MYLRNYLYYLSLLYDFLIQNMIKIVIKMWINISSLWWMRENKRVSKMIWSSYSLLSFCFINTWEICFPPKKLALVKSHLCIDLHSMKKHWAEMSGKMRKHSYSAWIRTTNLCTHTSQSHPWYKLTHSASLASYTSLTMADSQWNARQLC